MNLGDFCSCQKAGRVDGISKKSTSDKKGHTGQIFSLALSTDMKFLVSILILHTIMASRYGTDYANLCV